MNLTLINLSVLLETFYEVSVKTSKSEPPSDAMKQLYFEILKDLDFETVNKNGFDHFKKNRYFPAACDLRGEIDKINEAKADHAYRIIEFVMKKYFIPEFPQTSMNIIKHKLNLWNESALLPLADRWGMEIFEGSNPSATRAQFLKSYLIENGEYYQLAEHKQKEISDRALELISPLIKEKIDG